MIDSAAEAAGSWRVLLGPRWAYLLSLSVFGAGSLVCAAAPGMEVLLVGRGPLKWIFLTLGVLMAATMVGIYVPLSVRGSRTSHRSQRGFSAAGCPRLDVRRDHQRLPRPATCHRPPPLAVRLVRRAGSAGRGGVDPEWTIFGAHRRAGEVAGMMWLPDLGRGRSDE